MASKLTGVFEHVNGLEKLSDESPIKTLTRSLIAKWSCKSGVKKCNQQSLANAKQWQQLHQRSVEKTYL